MPVCPRCNKKFGGFLDLMSNDYTCQDCAEAAEKEKAKARQQAITLKADVQQRAKAVILTTTHSVEGYPIDEYLGIESVEIVMGTGMFSEFGGAVADIFGQRSTGFEAKLAQAKQTACQLLQLRAAEKGANAVVGVDMDFTEFSGNRIGIILNGTLVKILEPYRGEVAVPPPAKVPPPVRPLTPEERERANRKGRDLAEIEQARALATPKSRKPDGETRNG